MNQNPVRRQIAASIGLAVAIVLLVTGCTPVFPSAVRLNADGSVDFVSCYEVEDVVDTSATTTLRTGPNGSVDESTATTVALDPPIVRLDAGQVIRFVGLPEEWDRLDIRVDGAGAPYESYGIGERDSLVIGEWRWQDQAGIQLSKARCEIDEPEA